MNRREISCEKCSHISKAVGLTFFFVLILLPATFLMGQNEFSAGPIYHHSYMKTQEGSYKRIQSPGLNVSFVMDFKLDLIFSFNAYIPVWLEEDGISHISYDYYQYPVGFDILVGPRWSIPLGTASYLQPSIGLYAGYTNLSGVGYSTVNSLPLGIGGDLRFKTLLSEKLILGFVVAASWNFVDLLHTSSRSSGYMFMAGITLGTRFGPSPSSEGDRK